MTGSPYTLKPFIYVANVKSKHECHEDIDTRSQAQLGSVIRGNHMYKYNFIGFPALVSGFSSCKRGITHKSHHTMLFQ